MNPAKLHPQRFLNGEVHDWYRIILGYSDHLVGGLLDEFHLDPKASVLDPFCGSGTTLVEGMKRGLRVTGLDANPSSCFAARVKTDWSVDPERLRALLPGKHLLPHPILFRRQVLQRPLLRNQRVHHLAP